MELDRPQEVAISTQTPMANGKRGILECYNGHLLRNRKADRRYDAVFFGLWISHVPEDKFTSFSTMVAEALTPGGHVFFFDDNYRPEVDSSRASALRLSNATQ